MARVREYMVGLAYQLLGTPSVLYAHPEAGMSLETGMDCSGFISYLVARANEACDTKLVVPRHANEQFRNFGEPVHYLQRQPGDLVYFARRRGSHDYSIGHVGLVVARSGYIHSPGINDAQVELATLPDDPVPLKGAGPGDIYAVNPAGIKRLSLPLDDSRWHAW